ncbi:NADH pyrophosphatase [Arthrobacter sp. Hiyo6]|nr:NADH pyrophosphatase [Arthrobacter sp. Hiyo6]
MDTVLPVRPALVDRGSGARMKPGMVEALVSSGTGLAMVISHRQALVRGGALVLMERRSWRRVSGRPEWRRT